MPVEQIPNPKGAFGYDVQDADRIPAEVWKMRNMSSAQTIPAGAAVIWSTLSTDGTGVTITTVAGSPLFIGVAVTSATTGQSTELTSNAKPETWCDVVVRGPVAGALLTSGTVPGDMIGTVNSTTPGSTGGGVLGPILSTQVAGAFYGVAGVAFSSGTTGTTGYLTANGPRGYVVLRPTIIPGSTL